MTGKKVLCHFCKTPIHIERWGGVCKFSGDEIWFCDNIVCLIQLIDLRKKYKKGGKSGKIQT